MAGDEHLDTCTVRDANIYISIKGKQLDGMQRFLFWYNSGRNVVWIIVSHKADAGQSRSLSRNHEYYERTAD